MIVCPFCYDKFDKREIIYRCENPNDQACPKTNDVPLAHYYQQPTFEAKKVIRPKKSGFRLFGAKVSHRVRCLECNQHSTKKICPLCHNELPNSFHAASSHIISIVGARNSGKSTYITVLINELERKGYKLDLAIWPQDVGEDPREQTSQRYQNRYKKILMGACEELPQTSEGEKDLYPLIYKITSGQNRLLRDNALYLAFYDTAGESFKDRSKLEKLARYVGNSSGIIFLLDTYEIEYVHSHLKTLIPGASSEDNVDAYREIIRQTVQIFSKNPELMSRSIKERFYNKEKKITIPSAIVFNKLDAIIENKLLPSTTENILINDSHFLNTEKYDITKVEEVSRAIRETLEDWNETGFTRNVDEVFNNHKYFAISSLGAKFHNRPQIEREIHPIRVLDPLVWILDQVGFALPK